MKTSKEMADSVFQIRDALIDKRKKRIILARKAVTAAAAACVMGGIFLGVRHIAPERNKRPDISLAEDTSVSEITTTSPASHTAAAKTTSGKAERTTESKTYTSIRENTSVTSAVTTEIAEENDGADTEVSAERTDDSNDARTRPAATSQTRITITEVTKTTAVVTLAPTSETGSHNDTSEQSVTGASHDHPSINETQVNVTPASVSWEDLPVEKQYTEAFIEDRKYISAEKEVPEDMLGDYIDEIEMAGYDQETEHNCKAKAYRLKEYPNSEAIAIRFEGSDKYYFYVIEKE
ncbi:MAG TPA: hypothetical protein PLH98_10160 [Ruminococcus flavefaciens]|nr:hypothetical protein [Ruminococcus flavefaciens]HQM00900.1 hypothetical protein [Ruminococcus flavefaciens]